MSYRHSALCASLIIWALPASVCAAPVSVASPNGGIKIDVQADAGGHLMWSVHLRNRMSLSPAPLGLTIDGKDLGDAVTLGKPRIHVIDEKYPTFGNHAVAANHCKEAIIPAESAGMKYEVQVRAFDDGAAVRLYVPLDDATHTIAGEATAWAPPENARYWWAHYDQGYENTYDSGGLTSVPSLVPLQAPLTLKDDDLYISLTEADNDSFPDMALWHDGKVFKSYFPASPNGWSRQGPVTTPWRVAIIAKDLNGLVNSDIVTNLCPPPPPELASASWIKPGRSLWQWWSIGAPHLDDQKQWIDAARSLKFEYYLIDDGWRTWRAPGKDQWQCLKDVIDYGKTQGVACLVWVDSKEMLNPAARHDYLNRVAAAGAAGVKIDFIPPCTSEITRWYDDTLKDTADLHLLCNFHGAVKPTGRRRAWPHELTREAVRGLEYQMTRYGRVLPGEHDEIVPFTRLLAGPADYTPTTFDPHELVGFTWGHMLAQAVVMTSPLLHFGGGYKDFIGNPAEDFVRNLPSTWDQTIVLPGSEIGKTAGFARRRGRDWFVGILNGSDAASLNVDLSFLGRGHWHAEVFGDTPGAPAAFARESKTVTSKDTLPVTMSARGGVALWITKATR